VKEGGKEGEGGEKQPLISLNYWHSFGTGRVLGG